MPPADDNGARPTRAAVDRQLLDAARHRTGSPTAETDGHWTACVAPGRVAVVDADGGLRACEYGTRALAGSASSLEEFRAQASAELGSVLAEAQLPLPHCRGCAIWCGADLHAAAPLVRDYGALPANEAEQRTLGVLRLDADGRNARCDEAAFVASLDACEVVAIEGPDVFASGTAAQLLASWRAQPGSPRVAVRTQRLPDVEVAHAALTGVEVEALELDVATIDDDAIATLAEAARRIGTAAVVRFTLTPTGWFDFERAIDAAAAHGLSVDMRILDRTGSIPLDTLSAEQAALVRDAVIDCWSRLHGDSRPSSLKDGDFDRLCQELRLIVGRRVDASHDSRRTPPATELSLPPLDHPWQVGSRADTWHRRLLWRAHTATVRTWIDTVADAEALQAHAWLRALAHRIAHDTQTPALLGMLQVTYGNARHQRELAEQDHAFAERFELGRFGGPWAQRIGLGPPQPRRRPFRIGEPSAFQDTDRADVTVLIPSYRHARFIKQTLQSVLAQRGVPFRVLVADDRSPDKTVAVAQSLDDPRIEVRVNESNVGLGNSVLQALEAIDTEFVALLNSDDLLHPDHLATCRQALLDDPSAMLACCDIQPVDARGGKLDTDNVSLVRDGKQVFEWIRWFARVRPEQEVEREHLFGELLERNFLITSSNLFARTAWLRRQAEALRSLKYCLDWRLFLQAAAENALVHVRQPLIAYRLHGSNTVWFDADRRYTYYLEVNRVVAESLRQFAAHHPDPDVAIERVLDAVAHHVANNGEIDGYALFLNAAVDTLQLDRLATESPRARELLLELSAAADRRRTGDDATVSADTEAQMLSLELEHLRSLLNAERGQRRWLQVSTDHQAETLAQSEETNRKIWAEKQRLEQVRQDLEQQLRATRENLEATHGARERLAQELRRTAGEREELQALKSRIAEELAEERQQLQQKVAELARLLSQLDELQGELARAHEHGARIAEQLAHTQGQLSDAEEQLALTRTDLATTNESLATERRAHEATTSALDETRHDLEDTRRRHGSTDRELQTTRTELEATKATLDSTNNALDDERTRLVTSHAESAALRNQLQSTRDDLRAARRRQQETRAELERTIASREFRIGNLLWNRLPLASLSRRLKKWYRKLLDARTRFAVHRLGQPAAPGRVVVAATRVWPVYSHTFVYQEVVGMLDAGLDVRFFFWDSEKPMRLHAAFDVLRERRVQLQSVWSTHEKDRAWFERTRPAQLADFLGRIAELTGRTVADLRDDGIVQRGCTYARMVELSRATYLHSYFFYDMSFMAMMAAWLLELPRGITCYADHMLDDYPWKFVPLHLETCDVIVATSARIKRELSSLTGGRYDEKILVKPNGVDGRRFPAITREPRQAGAAIELLSVSRLEAKKGLTHLVDAVAELTRRGLTVTVHIVGSEDPHSPGSVEYADEFRARIGARGVADRFVLHGALRQEQLPPLLQRCRVFVAPYVEVETGDKDGIPTAVLEAMASGLAIVATDSGSLCEVVADDREALVVSQRDSRALADALQRLIEQPPLEQRLSAAARTRFERQFDSAVTEPLLHERIRAAIAARA